MANYQAKDDLILGRQLKVQRLVIPFTLTASATPSAVALANDEPSRMFLQSEGVDQITDAKASGETATFSVTPVDADGTLNIFIKLNEAASKVCRASMVSRATGVAQPVKLGDADGLSSLGNLMLTLDSSVDHSTTNVDGCIEVEYIIAE